MAKKILVVDDEPEIVELVANRLKKEGYSTLVANDSTSAMEKIKEETPDLVILDIMLPGVEGTKLCWIIKNGERFKHIPVIIISGKKDENMSQLMKTIKADAFLAKPFEAKDLTQAVRKILKSK